MQDILPLGLKDHRCTGNALDPSDRDGPATPLRSRSRTGRCSACTSRTRSPLSRRQTVPGHRERGRLALQRRLPGFDEEVVSQLQLHARPERVSDAAALKAKPHRPPDGDQRLGRHRWRRRLRPDRGVRRALVLDPDHRRALVWDSGDQFEQYFADPANGYAIFNASHDGNAPTTAATTRARSPKALRSARWWPDVRLHRPRAHRRRHGLRRQGPDGRRVRRLRQDPRAHRLAATAAPKA